MTNEVKCEKHLTDKTSDGWELPITRYTSDETIATPVILCHGLAANKHSVDFGEFKEKDWRKYSLACFLSNYEKRNEFAFDMWVAELRGRGENPSFDPEENPEKYRWTVDDYIDKDVPTIIDYVQDWYCKNKECKVDEKPKVYWIGKSMGGMIAYGYGQKEDGFHNFKGVITLGSPTAFHYWKTALEILARITPRRAVGHVNASKFFIDHPRVCGEFKKNVANEENIDMDILDRYIEIGMNNTISLKVLTQFMVFYRHNNFCKYPHFPWAYDTFGRIPFFGKIVHPYSYKYNLEKFKTALCAIAGGVDNAAPPLDVQYTAGHVGSSDITYHNFCKQSGCEHDYGHFDLNMGLNVRKEVYPYLYDWLLRQENMG